MDGALFSAIATAFAAVSTGISAWSVRQVRKRELYEIGHQFEDRLDPLTKQLMTRLGPPDDGINPPEFRMLASDLFVLYSQAYRAHERGVYPSDQWDGVNSVFAYWVSRPELNAAWLRLSEQIEAWPPGFPEFVNQQVRDYQESRAEPLPSGQPLEPFDSPPRVH